MNIPPDNIPVEQSKAFLEGDIPSLPQILPLPVDNFDLMSLMQSHYNIIEASVGIGGISSVGFIGSTGGAKD